MLILSDGTRILSDGTWMEMPGEMLLRPGAVIPFGSLGVRILDIPAGSGRMLVISEGTVRETVYNKGFESVDWESSDARQWLNSEFLKKIPAEFRKVIPEVLNENPDNPFHHTWEENSTREGKPTRDRIFLLNLEEACRYFTDAADREAGKPWWLRTPGGTPVRAVVVDRDGSIDEWGWGCWDEKDPFLNLDDDLYHEHYAGLRPAFWIDLESDDFPGRVSRNPDGTVTFSWYMLAVKDGILRAAYNGLKKANLPADIKEIAPRAFSGGKELESVTFEGPVPEIKRDSFVNCPKLRLPGKVYQNLETVDKQLFKYLPENDPEAMAEVLSEVEYLSMAGEPLKRMSAGDARKTAEALLNLLERKEPWDWESVFRFALGAADLIPPEILRKLKDMLGQKNVLKPLDSFLLEREIGIGHDPGAGFCMPAYWPNPEVFLKRENITEEEKKALERLPALSGIFAAVSGYEEQYDNSVPLGKWRLGKERMPGWKGSFGKPSMNVLQYKTAAFPFEKEKGTDQAASLLDHEAFMELLESWSRMSDSFYIPYAAFADENRLAALLRKMKLAMIFSKKREWGIRVRGAVLLNDSLPAMRYAESANLLDRYAAMRGSDPETIREQYLAEPGPERERGQDSSGRESEFGELEEYEKDVLLERFLSGKTMTREHWDAQYGTHPVLRELARRIVWEQAETDHCPEPGKNTAETVWRAFVPDESGNPADVSGHPVVLGAGEIRVAHPMEMGPEKTREWKKYFSDRNIKQPFPQMREPVTDPALVKPERYEEYTFRITELKDKEKHGIILIDYFGQVVLQLRDCSAELKTHTKRLKSGEERIEIRNFRFEQYTRAVNHIISVFNAATIKKWIALDDIAVVAPLLDRFTEEEIGEFIDLALEKNSFNVTAILLEWQKKHMKGPKDLFSL